MRSTSTLISVIEPRLVAEVRDASNVSIVSLEVTQTDDVVGRHAAIQATWRRAMQRSSIFTLVDVDPLAVVVEEWAKRLTNDEHDLEVAVGLVSQSTPVPDYYFVPSGLEPPIVDWYFDLVLGLAASRVVAIGERVDTMLSAISRLPHGRELPSAPVIAASARDYVPLPRVAEAKTARSLSDDDTTG